MLTDKHQEAPVTDRIHALLAGFPHELYLAGRWRPAADGATFAVDDPATGTTLAEVADAAPSDGLLALDAASAAQADWAATAPRVRADLLRALYDAVLDRIDDLALVMTHEMGKSLAESRGEVAYAAEFLRWFSEEAVRPRGDYRLAPDGRKRILVTSRPVGPCLLITPWNFPLAMATRKLAPALAAGCTTVLKPAALTPLTSLLLTQLAHEVGVPAGVVNVVPTSRAGALTTPLLADARLRKLSFTGSTEVGRVLLRQAAEHVLRTSMELGGNAPFLVFADADLDAAVDGALAAKFRNIGEACTAANRFLVEASVAEEFTRRMTERAARLRVGHGADAGVDLGPLVDAKARTGVHALVADAVAHGATVATGGAIPDGPGFFYPPTVLTGADAAAAIHTEEIFGPVVSIRTFADEDEAVTLANDSASGLASYVYTGDLTRALRLVDRLHYGMVGLNAGVISDAAAPFGGVKESGLGREGSHEGLLEYLDTVYVGIGGATG